MAHHRQRRSFHETTVAVGPREKTLEELLLPSVVCLLRRSHHCGFVNYVLRSCCWHKSIISTKPQWRLALVRKHLRSFSCQVLFSSATQSRLWFRELFLEELLLAQRQYFYETSVAVGPREKNLRSCCGRVCFFFRDTVTTVVS